MDVISALIYLYREGAEGKKGSETGPQLVSEWVWIRTQFDLQMSILPTSHSIQKSLY